MSALLFVTWDGGGNVPPATALAHELARRGHAVRFLGHPSQERPLTSQGFAFVRPRHARAFDATTDYRPLRMLGVLADVGMGRDLLDAVAAEPTDLVVIDSLMFGALDAARRAGLRYAVLEHMYAAAYRSGMLGGPMGLNLRLRGLAPARALDDAALRLLMTLPQLDPAPAVANLSQVGPLATWSPRVEAEPTVVVGLSTFGYPGMAPVLQRLVDATEGLSARVLVSTGPTIDPAALRTRPGVEVHRWLAHGESLPGASVLVTHGGHGSTMAGLAHDLPLLVVPLDGKSDHEVVGRSIERAGAGRMIGRRASAGDLRDALRSLLEEPAYAAAAGRLGAAIRGTDAVGDGATALEALSNGAPTPGRPAARP
ncbi:glycosyltransferase [Nocardioides sp. YIM 152315]|uniref:glycosyltransferase n=1 Tax=Nocardioides sp. YIM 152315 TaxID=3031760 RepID=UPI0023DB5B66|nr:glycosyltransferase [Nocardioides sp. YIM 152315]MDF1606337.1 glycosyltransferase [Nocardioides sp. YIM 152315]